MLTFHQGISGEVKLTGSTPELDEFTLRVVDGLLPFALGISHSHHIPGPNNQAVTWGPHAHGFQDRIGKTHFMGRPLKSGDIWQAKGKASPALFAFREDLMPIYHRIYYESSHRSCS
jgi:mannosyl-oligosaccharide glucosidase